MFILLCVLQLWIIAFVIHNKLSVSTWQMFVLCVQTDATTVTMLGSDVLEPSCNSVVNKLSLQQAVRARRVVRRRGCHIF
jgi:hypothetical protein